MKKIENIDNTIRVDGEEVEVPDIIQYIAKRGGVEHTLSPDKLIRAVEDTNWCIFLTDEIINKPAQRRVTMSHDQIAHIIAERVVAKFGDA